MISSETTILLTCSDDKLRTHFSKFLSRFGRRLQFSVFEIKNSPRILQNIRTEIKASYEKKFKQGDSVLVMDVPDKSIIDRFGYAANEEDDLLFF